MTTNVKKFITIQVIVLIALAFIGNLNVRADVITGIISSSAPASSSSIQTTGGTEGVVLEEAQHLDQPQEVMLMKVHYPVLLFQVLLLLTGVAVQGVAMACWFLWGQPQQPHQLHQFLKIPAS